jgi:hypothetical protein
MKQSKPRDLDRKMCDIAEMVATNTDEYEAYQWKTSLPLHVAVEAKL